MGFFREELKEKCPLVFEHIFETLARQGCDWIYSFPDVYLVSFDRGEDATPNDPAKYDPGKAMKVQMEQEQQKAEVEKLQAKLEEERESAMEKAQFSPPPVVVRAYRKVYGRLPEGFPGA